MVRPDRKMGYNEKALKARALMTFSVLFIIISNTLFYGLWVDKWFPSPDSKAASNRALLRSVETILQGLGKFTPAGPFPLPSLYDLDNDNPLSKVMVLGNRQYVTDHFPIVIPRTVYKEPENATLVKLYVQAIMQLVQYYGIRVILDSDQTRGYVAQELLSQQRNSNTTIVLSHLFPVFGKGHGHFVPNHQFERIDFVMDYSQLFNLHSGIVPKTHGGKLLTMPYGNMPYSKFLNQSHESLTDTSTEVASLLSNDEPFVLACGSNRRDYSGVVYAAEKIGVRLVIADSHPENVNFTVSSKLAVLKTSFAEFNVLLANSLCVVVPAALPQETPVGIGTIAKAQMARKVTIATNNTGADQMISHGYDGFFVPDPSASYEAKHGAYEAIFRQLQNEDLRRQVEQNVDPIRYTYKHAGQLLARMGRGLVQATVNKTPLWTLHAVDRCQQCRIQFCDAWLVNDLDVGIRGPYASVSATSASELGCDRLRQAAATQIVRNSGTGKIYIAIMNERKST